MKGSYGVRGKVVEGKAVMILDALIADADSRLAGWSGKPSDVLPARSAATIASATGRIST